MKPERGHAGPQQLDMYRERNEVALCRKSNVAADRNVRAPLDKFRPPTCASFGIRISAFFRPLDFGFHSPFVILLLCSLLAPAYSAHASSQQTYLQCLTNFETYAETIWHDASGASRPTNAGYWGDGGSTGNGGIRGMCGVAVAYAVMVKALPGDQKTRTGFRISPKH